MNDKRDRKFALAGMNWTSSKIPKDVWVNSDENDNVGEAAHQDAYREAGRYQTLVGAITSGNIYDSTKHRAATEQLLTGNKEGYRSNHETERMVSNAKRNGKAKPLYQSCVELSVVLLFSLSSDQVS